MSCESNTIAVKELQDTVQRFLGWLEGNGYAGYDPYDIWGSRIGLLARRLYYARRASGYFLVAPMLVMEMIRPKTRALFLERQRFATADAQLALGFLNLYNLTKTNDFLAKSVSLCEDLVNTSIPGYSGHCWGYPFDWQTHKGVWKKNTPFITVTPYCFEAFAKLYDATRNSRYDEIARSIAEFTFSDLLDTDDGENASASGYGPFDRSKVINSSSYRAFVLFEAARRFGVWEFEKKARQNLNFILKNQNADGSWFYAVGVQEGRFIDHFHTCFVIKNLCKINSFLQDRQVYDAIQRGCGFYYRSLFTPKGTPRCFAVAPRFEIVRLEMYNIAEAITLGTLLRNQIPEAFAAAKRLSLEAGRHYQLADGHFVTRVYLGGLRHTLPFIRWPQAQMFYAITNLLTAIAAEPNDSGNSIAGLRETQYPVCIH